jgi:dTDP-4-amino-4,6-dideoxygalactose transaminase
MTNRIFLSAPDTGEVEERFVLAALRSGWVAPIGPDLDAFEAEMAERIGVSFAVAVSSGTAALHLGLLGLGVGPGDVVITSTMTFVATANAIVYTGAEPFFLDSELASGNMDPELLRAAVQSLRAAGRNVGAIVPVDLLGKAANYTAIEAIALEFGIPVLADAAESLGARHAGVPVGTFGRAAVFSFNGNKIMTTSGGGMLVTNDEDLAARVRYLSTQARQPVTHYEHVDVGYNYRLSNVLAAVGRAQLTRLDGMIERRRGLRRRYRDFFEHVDGVTIFGGGDDSEDNCWLTAITVDTSVTGWTPGQLTAALAGANIESRPLWKPMHLQPIFAQTPALVTGAAEKLFETGLTLPSGSALGVPEINRVFARMTDFLAAPGQALH